MYSVVSGPWPANERVADAFNLLGFKQIDIQMLLVSSISLMRRKSLLNFVKIVSLCMYLQHAFEF